MASSTKCVDSRTGLHAIACAETRYSDGILNRTAIFLEHPTTVMEQTPEGLVAEMEVKWHDKSDDDRKVLPTGSFDPLGNPEYQYAVYLRGVVIHEFGHISGLADLLPSPFPGFATTSTAELESVPSHDIRYLNQVYRNLHGSVPLDGQGKFTELGGDRKVITKALLWLGVLAAVALMGCSSAAPVTHPAEPTTAPEVATNTVSTVSVPTHAAVVTPAEPTATAPVVSDVSVPEPAATAEVPRAPGCSQVSGYAGWRCRQHHCPDHYAHQDEGGDCQDSY